MPYNSSRYTHLHKTSASVSSSKLLFSFCSTKLTDIGFKHAKHMAISYAIVYQRAFDKMVSSEMPCDTSKNMFCIK